MNCFSFLPNFICLPGYILDKKGMGALLKKKRAKTSGLAQKFRLFSSF